MKRTREDSPSSSHRPNSKPRLSGSNLQPLLTPRRYPTSSPTVYRQAANLENYYTTETSPHEVYSAPAPLDSSITASSGSWNSKNTLDENLPIIYDDTINIPALTHSPTPPLVTVQPDYIIVDRTTFRPLIGWSTTKRLNFDKNCLEDNIVGISQTSIKVCNFIPAIFNGIQDLKKVIWKRFRACGNIICVTVFREWEMRSTYNIQVDFEDPESAKRALTINEGYFHNAIWRPLRISRRAYGCHNWCKVRLPDLPLLQANLLDSSKKDVKLISQLETDYGDQFPLDEELPIIPEDSHGARSFTTLSDEYDPPFLTLDDMAYSSTQHDGATLDYDTRMRSVTPEIILDHPHPANTFRLTPEKRQSLEKKLYFEKARLNMKEHVHPDLAGLIHQNWTKVEVIQEEEDNDMTGNEIDLDEKETQGEGWEEFVHI
ncbi:uncharacterized protein L201_006391 [Kwoniella dendrophila CBS 6074]|uniref:RRM domain-containing protein n=1 Tax=Kwoniella dendrophila CBS 6074 TaxID=1295534 RepID=A0AAX4K3V5_9TREE